jgi:hypothetical protein
VSPVGGLLFFAIFPIIFTAWGWRYVVIPLLWPTIKFGFRLIMVLTWIGFGVGITGTGWFYRAFGFGLGDVIYSMAPTPKMGQHSRWERENSITPEGDYMVDWREKRHLSPLPEDWDGPVEHTSSPFLLLFACVGMVGVCVAVRAAERRRHAIDEMGATPRARQEVLARVERTMARQESRSPRRQQESVPTGWTVQEYADFVSALKHLGFTSKTIKTVESRVSGTLEEKIRQALRQLTQEHNV